MAANRRLAAIMFTDLVGSTAAAQRDERAALARQVEQETLLRPVFARHHGREIKSTGDGFLVEFGSALAATECAVEVQLALRERNAAREGDPLVSRIGIHLGDVEERSGDIFGDAVNIAARIEPLADPGGICLSDPVYVQIRNKVGYRFETMGARSLKGVREALEVYRVMLPGTSSPPVETRNRLPRLAVLPMSNISPDPENAYFADGLTEELIAVLSQIKGLRVISRTSVSQYRESTKSVAEIGNELGVDSVLEGSVRKAGNQLRITAQLIDTHSDEHRWAQTYDRTLENVFAIQADVAEKVANSLKVELLGSERKAIRERPTSNLEAYEQYLRALQARLRLGNHPVRDTDAKIVAYFEDAIRKDPEFSAAYAHLAGHLIEVSGETRPTKDVAPRIRELVARALELDPDSAESYSARGYLRMQLDHDWPGAEQDLKRAIALNANSPTGHRYYAHLADVLQRFEEAELQYRLALEQDPLNVGCRVAFAIVPAQLGDLPEAIDRAEKLLAAYPDERGARSVLTAFYALMGRTDDALRTVAPLGTDREQLSRWLYAFDLALLGKTESARKMLADWEAGRLPEAVQLRHVAEMYAVIGERERVLDLLERDAREGDDGLWSSYQLPVFDGLREEPRFLTLLRRLRLPTTIRRPLFSNLASRFART